MKVTADLRVIQSVIRQCSLKGFAVDEDNMAVQFNFKDRKNPHQNFHMTLYALDGEFEIDFRGDNSE